MNSIKIQALITRNRRTVLMTRSTRNDNENRQLYWSFNITIPRIASNAEQIQNRVTILIS